MSSRHKKYLIIVGLILLINLFWLPAFSYWHIYPHGQLVTTNLPPLLAYNNHQIPHINTKNLPEVLADSYILIDPDSNQILASKNAHNHIFPASTTKMATAITALNIYPLDEVVTVSELYEEGQTMKLQVGEKITVRSLVNALLVYSANDAAFNLASHHPKSVPGFITEMNNIAQKYGLKDTHFTNFDGLHDPNHYTSVYDLSQFARLAIKNDTVRQAVKQQQIKVTDISNTITHELSTTDELLGNVPEIEGLKTGWTPEAKGCFVGLIHIGDHYLISVVASSDDRFGDTRRIIDWSKTNLTWSDYTP